MGYLSIWNKKNIKYVKQKYNFFQGINNLTQKCEEIFKYKKCGFLMDLNVDFCIHENEICPFNDINTSFYLNNLTSDLIFSYEDKNLTINNKYKINDFSLIYINKIIVIV